MQDQTDAPLPAEAPAPYLPPATPTDNPPEAPQKTSGRKTLLWWVLLVLLFVVIYQVLASKPGRHQEREPAEHEETAWWVHASPVGLSVLLIGGFIFLVRRQIRGGNRFDLAQEDGHLALALGDPAGAARVFESVLQQYRGQAQYTAVARHNLARALLQQGRLDEACALAIQVERTPGLIYGTEVRLLAGLLLCEIYTVRGELDAASRWLQDCRRRLTRTRHRLYTAAMLRVAETLLLCRQERYAEARKLLDQDQLRMEGSLTVQGMRPVWLLRAFAAAQLAGPREQGEAARWLVHLQPYRPGEFANWIDRWPALRAFVAAHLHQGAGEPPPA